MTTMDSLKYVREDMAAYYPMGEFKVGGVEV
jgi:hypothetical protein